MKNDFSWDEAVWFLFALLVAIGIVALVCTATNNQYGRDNYCASTYGKNWYYVSGDRSPDFCTNDKGELRFPKEW